MQSPERVALEAVMADSRRKDIVLAEMECYRVMLQRRWLEQLDEIGLLRGKLLAAAEENICLRHRLDMVQAAIEPCEKHSAEPMGLARDHG